MEPLIELRFDSRADELRRVRDVVRKAMRARGCAADELNFIVLAIDEACANIIRHAYGVQPKGDIILEIFDDHGQAVFRLTDFADPVDANVIRPQPVDELSPGGLGVHFINEIMDEVRFLDPPQGVGNILEMRKALTRKAAELS
ncbi:MAG: ATP-binding protein [Gammaproteobacteria bacterium]